MELKYYLRGLGLGIAITAVIMGIFTSKNKSMTNEEIIARAKQLGMTEDTVLSDMHSDKEDDNHDANDDVDNSGEDRKVGQTETEADDMPDSDKQADEEAKQDEMSETDGQQIDSEADDSSERVEVAASGDGARTTDTGTDAEAGEPDIEIPDTETPDTDTSTQTAETVKGSVVLTIGRGDGSYTVSKKLADLGAVSSAGEFDTFLCGNGYDKRIRTGTYTIPAGASDEQLARIITGME